MSRRSKVSGTAMRSAGSKMGFGAYWWMGGLAVCLPLFASVNQPSFWSLSLVILSFSLAWLSWRRSPLVQVLLRDRVSVLGSMFLLLALVQCVGAVVMGPDIDEQALHLWSWPTTVNIGLTIDALIKYLCFSLVFFVAGILILARARREVALWILVAPAAVIAFVAVADEALGLSLWSNTASTLDGVRIAGPFRGANAFAAYLGMSSLGAMSLVMFRWVKLPSSGQAGSKRDRYRGLVKELVGPLGAAIFVWVVIVIGVLQTGSRGAVSASILANIVIVGMSGRIESGGNKARPFWRLSFFVAAISLAFYSLQSIPDRLSVFTIADAGRSRIWDATLKAIEAQPVFGYGLGSFKDVYPIYQSTYDWALPVFYAHSNILEVALGGGIVGVILVISLGGTYLWRCAAATFQGAFFGPLGIGSVTYLVIHGAVDDPLATPANIMIAGVLLAIGYSGFIKRNLKLESVEV